MSTLLDILKKDRNRRFQWLETANDIETAKARVLKLSAKFQDEFVIFSRADLKVVARTQVVETEMLRELIEA
jgi:hypothetical protein